MWIGTGLNIKTIFKTRLAQICEGELPSFNKMKNFKRFSFDNKMLVFPLN